MTVCWAHVRAGQTVVDMTTATVAVNREVAASLAEKNVDFADAPVARGVPAAQDGTLAITVGASDEVLARIQPYLACMGKDISHCGGRRQRPGPEADEQHADLPNRNSACRSNGDCHESRR